MLLSRITLVPANNLITLINSVKIYFLAIAIHTVEHTLSRIHVFRDLNAISDD